MNPKCAKCEKTVYPLEKLNCLDKFWHKACFKCWECGMTLNMKNYKGYDKKPYCNAHYPSMKHTQVAETPEMARIAQNTKLQSNVTYHKRFEEDKGKYTTVTDSRELRRLLESQETLSLIKYHEDFEKNIKGTKIQVADDPETARIRQNMATISQVEYKGLRKQHDNMESQRGNIGKDVPHHHQPAEPIMRQRSNEEARPSPYSSRSSGSSTVYTHSGEVEAASQPRRVGSIADYDPMNDNFGSLTQKPPGSYSGAQWQETVSAPQAPPPQQQPVHDVEPPLSNGGASSPVQQGPMVQLGQPLNLTVTQPEPQAYHQPPPPADPVPPPSSYNQPPPPQQAPPKAAGMVRKALYDYTAGDDDEVSFQENDLIINCEPIDEGWMFGTNERTGQRGMLPANYVGPV